MNTSFFEKIKYDLKESQIDFKIVILFLPIAFGSFLFHEFGHWTLGEIFGNKMILSLNNAAPKSGVFIDKSSALWSAIGGPLFTIIQGLLFLYIIWGKKSVIAYSITFFAVFLRFYSVIFGGMVSLQDEVRISEMLEINKIIIPVIVLSILVWILWKANKIMKFDFKVTGYYTILGVFAILIVIGCNELIIID